MFSSIHYLQFTFKNISTLDGIACKNTDAHLRICGQLNRKIQVQVVYEVAHR